MNIYFVDERLVGVRCSDCSLLAVVVSYAINKEPTADIEGNLDAVVRELE